ncbi:MAG: amino acid ABC transporter permease, partial [Geopsychrobacter sp.]|nr:amino acid ABC transporter permease [Geopsychrobacter sp.]
MTVNSSSPKVWPWRLLTLAILFVLAASLFVATKKIDYTWRWNRVPQYFFYHAENIKTIPFDGRVVNLTPSGTFTTVELESAT